MLGGAGEHLVVVHEHVGPLGAGQRLAVGQQVAHGQGGQLRFQNAAGEIEDALQQPCTSASSPASSQSALPSASSTSSVQLR